MKFSVSTWSIALALAAGAQAHAEEGMWPLDNLPLQHLQSTYGFTPMQAWIAQVMHASARLALGCSASFVSPDGLVMTNHHCAQGCLADLTDGAHDLSKNGYVAESRAAERKCPGMELDQLQSISDVTAQVSDATRGKSGAAYNAARHAAESAIETSCAGGDPKTTRCDVITLYHGGRYALYRYKRFDDVRISFSPENAIANFGGDPDNFNFPRYDLDVTFLRAYENGKPARTPFFPLDPKGPSAGEFVMTSGNPGATERDTTAAELEAVRDIRLPVLYAYYENLDGVLWEMRRQGPAQDKIAGDAEWGIQNTLKVYGGRLQALDKPGLISGRQIQERALSSWIDADPQRKASFGDPFAAIADTVPAEATLYGRYLYLEGFYRPLAFYSREFALARTLVRAASERSKPDAKRLPEFRDAKLPAVRATVLAAAAIHASLEETTLAFSLTKMRQALGADDPTVRLVLGKETPDEVARRLVGGTTITDPAVRRALWDGGEAAIEASKDPMIVFARLVDPAARAVRKQWEDDVEAPRQKNSETIARARFARDGTSQYPDATFTERLSFGTVRGWDEKGSEVAPFTDFAGLYDRATGSAPFALPPSWIAAKGRLDLATPFDFVTTNDIIGGNSGSPMIDRDAHVVGLVFDGNIHSLAGDFVYDETDNRTIAVDTTALLAALRVVYKDQWLADELEPKGRTATD